MKVLFVGPSLPDAAVLCGRTIHVRPPAAHGDVLAAVRAGATAIGIVDGNFEHVAPVWHKEILHALDKGIAVFGAASMGALRAAECHTFGMVGIGPDPETGKPSLGYWLGTPYWGKGYATEAARALIDAFFAYGEMDELTASGETVKGAATALLGAMRILVPLAGLIDVAAERERLGKQLARTRDDLGRVRRKLENQSFVANAPPDIVAKEHARIAELDQRAAQLSQQLVRLAELD